MSVFKRGKVFYTDFVIDGIRVCKSTGKTSKREAKHVEAVERQKLLSGAKKQKASKVSLQTAIENVYESKWKNNKDGMGSYRRARLLLEHMGDVVLSSVGRETVDNLIRKLEGTGIESSTINRYLATLKTILKHYRLQADFIKLMKENNNSRIRVITKDEELRILELLREAKSRGKKPYYTDVADLIACLCDSGCRLSELLKDFTYKQNVNFETNLISLFGPQTKSGKPRSIPMTQRCRRIMEQRQLMNPIRPFTLSKHEAERAWQWVRAEMGLEGDNEFVIHCATRHTFASRLLNKNVPLATIRDLLGHSSVLITERVYAHLCASKLVEAVDMLE
jgi:integrase